MGLKLASTALLLLVAISASAGSFKKDYCENQEYFNKSGKDVGSKYPHLHCGKDFVTYSKSKKNHINFLKGSTFNVGQANNICSQQGGNKIEAVVKKICNDYDKVCDACA